MAVYRRREDGHTYYHLGGILFAAPTRADGKVYWSESIEVEDFDIPLLPAEKEYITTRLLEMEHKLRQSLKKDTLAS